jgi:hypothetical protein
MPVPALLGGRIPALLVFVLLGFLIMLLFGNRWGLHDYRYGAWIKAVGIAVIVVSICLVALSELGAMTLP